MWDIQLFKLNFDESEITAAADVVAGGWLSMGENIQSFENNFGDFLGNSSKCRAVANGTAALHMAMIALNIGEGDEVIIPSLTFIANANVVNLVGAIPVITDSTSLTDWNVSLDEIKSKVNKKTKAVIVVHYAGYPLKDIKEISDFCKENNIYLIEDVAHAPGASVGGQKCGTFGDIGCFSFFSNKNLAIGEGGMVSTKNTKLIEKLSYLRSHGMTALSFDKHKGRAVTYDVLIPGLNYRMDEIRAAIGNIQLKKLSASNKSRAKLTEIYRSNLKNSSIIIPFEDQPRNTKSVFHILPVLLPKNKDRSSIIEELKTSRIQSSIHYPPFWSFSAFKGDFSPKDAPVTAEICNRQLTLPLFPTMKKSEVQKVTDSLLEAIK